MAFNRPAGDSGAIFYWTKTLPNNATWTEDFKFYEGSATAMTLTGLDFKITLRESANDTTPVLAISTEDNDGRLSLSNSTTLTATVSPTYLSDLEGDYIADMASKDGSGVITLWAHGVITIRNSPPVWS